jgi:ribonuclease HI
VYCDEAWGNAGAEASTILISPFGIKLRYVARLQFTKDTNKCTNNIIEYKAVLQMPHKLRAMGVQHRIIKRDSKVIKGRIEKEAIARDATLENCLALIRKIENYFKGFIVEYIERCKNAEADELAKAAARKTPLP